MHPSTSRTSPASDQPDPPRQEPDGALGHLLIVDDLTENRDLLARRLAQFGHRCLTADSGAAALALLAQDAFDVVLLDLMMPGMDGYEVLTRIKGDPRIAHIPVIMVSALDEIESTVRCIELGAADYLTKPINPVLLRARIDSCLREKRLRDLEAAQLQALQQSYRREQHIAEVFQQSLILPIAEDAFPGLAVAPFYESAWREAEVGGDLYDAFTLPGGNVVLAVADASGKGLDAAVRVMQVKFVLRAFAREYPDDPARIVERVNAFLCDAKELDGEQAEAFVTLVLAIVDRETGALTLLSAGGEPPLLIRAAGGMEPAVPGNLPLGIAASAGFQTQATFMEPGDVLLLCTDGITEARRDRDLLGYDGMMALAERARPLDGLADKGAFILDGAREFGSGSLRDDACLLLARRT